MILITKIINFSWARWLMSFDGLCLSEELGSRGFRVLIVPKVLLYQRQIHSHSCWTDSVCWLYSVEQCSWTVQIDCCEPFGTNGFCYHTEFLKFEIVLNSRIPISWLNSKDLESKLNCLSLKLPMDCVTCWFNCQQTVDQRRRTAANVWSRNFSPHTFQHSRNCFGT